MRAIVVAVAAAGLLSVSTSTARAQDEKDVAAWFAMMFTPYGALPPIVARSVAAPVEASAVSTLEMKYGHWGFDGSEEGWNIFGLGGRLGRVGFTGGYARCEGCDDGVIMAQVDFDPILAAAPFLADAAGGSYAIAPR